MQDVLEAPQMDVVKFNVTDSEIAKMKDEYMGLTINGIEDRAGLKKVYDSRQIVKKTRTSLVKHADELKEQAIAWQKKVNTEKNRVVSELEAIEDYLQAQEDEISAIKEKIKAEAEEKERARIQDRIDKLAGYGFQIDFMTISVIDDAGFEKVLNNAKIEHEKELAQKAEAEKLAREKEAQLKAEREELEKLRAQQAESQRIIDEHNARIAQEQRDKEEDIRREQQRLEAEGKRIAAEKEAAERQLAHAQQVAKARQEAAEAARLQAIEDTRIAAELKDREQTEAKAEADRQAALRPDKEKLQAFSDTIGAIAFPSVQSEAAQAVVNEVKILINRVEAHIIKKIKSL